MFGSLTFPGIIRWIACFQILTLMLNLFSPSLIAYLEFDRGSILSGEVWRLVTWVALPVWNSVLFLIVALFMFFISSALDEAFGPFRVNVYVVAVIACLAASGMLPFASKELVGHAPGLTGIARSVYAASMGTLFMGSMIMGAACVFPNYVIHLWAIIPIKMKWLGIVYGALIASLIGLSSTPLFTAILVSVGLLPFLVGILPIVLIGLKNSAEASARRAKFQQSNAAADVAAFHTCKNCGITDVKDPTMAFRVSGDDGEEYCEPCRDRKQVKA